MVYNKHQHGKLSGIIQRYFSSKILPRWITSPPKPCVNTTRNHPKAFIQGWHAALRSSPCCLYCALPCCGADLSYIGCFQEPQEYISANADRTSRPLTFITDSSAMTVELCQQLAKGKGYAYAGLQFGRQCYGGNSSQMYWYTNIKCTKPCSGDPSRTCGDAWTNAIYLTGKAPNTRDGGIGFDGR